MDGFNSTAKSTRKLNGAVSRLITTKTVVATGWSFKLQWSTVEGALTAVEERSVVDGKQWTRDQRLSNPLQLNRGGGSVNPL